MKCNANEMMRALDAPPAATRLFLLCGPDEAASSAFEKRLERSLGPGVERVDIESSALKNDPVRLSDEAASFSMFGEKRFIRINTAGDECVSAVQALLELTVQTNPVIALAGALKPTSALLKLALARGDIMVCVSHPPSAADAEALAVAIARGLGLRLPRDVAKRIAAAAANDRAIMAQEIEKIALYLDAGPQNPADVTSEVIDQIGASINDSALSNLTEAVLGGRGEATTEALKELKQDGISGVPMLRALQKRVALLVDLSAAIHDTGSSPDSVVESRGKAIFFREKAGILRDVKRWQPDQLATASNRLLAAERAIKSAANAGDVLAETEIIRVMRAAARLR
jgi:DNA polymerase III subunit delta